MLRSRMGFGALALLIATVSVIASLLPVAKAHAVLPPSGGSGPVVSFIDAGHIAVNATGTFTDSQGQKLDISPATGMYFDGQALADGRDWPLSQSSNPNFWFDGNKGSTCPGNNSNVTIQSNSYSAGSNGILATLNLYVPETGTNTPNKCGKITITNVSVGDTAVGGSIGTFKLRPKVGIVVPHTGITVNSAASTTLFYEASASEIVEAGADPSYGGGSQYTFSLKANGSSNFVQNSGTNVSGNCPDYITLSNPTGQYVVADYYTFEENPNCGTTPTGHFQVLVLTTTPEAMLAQLTGGSTGTGAAGAGGTAAPPDNCPIQNWALRWLVCPVIDAIDAAVAPLNSYLDNLLTIPTDTFDASQNPGKAYFSAWGDFRDIAVSLLIIVALVMIIGQSAGFDLLDAYSIRKILPRLLVGAIGMTLSWVIVGFIVQFFNNLGNWTGDIILSPFQGLYNNGAALSPTGVLGTIEGGGGILLAGGATIVSATAAIAILGIPAIITLILTLFLAMIVAFVTLTIRTMIIILTMITAPVAIVAYILPTTQKVWEFWRSALLDALVVFPIVAAFLAAGRVLAILAVTGKGITPILAPIAIIVSYFMIGTAFRMAGGLIGSASGAVSNAHGGAFGGLKKYRQGKRQERMHKIANGEEVFKNTNPVARRLNPIVQGIGVAPKAIAQNPFNAKRWRTNIANKTTRAETHEAAEIAENNDAVKEIINDDVKVWAIMETTAAGGQWAREHVDERLTDNEAGVRQSLKNHGFTGSNEELELTVSKIMDAKKSSGNGTALLQAAVQAQAKTGTGYGIDQRTGASVDAQGNAIDGAGQMMQWTDIAYGENTNGAGNAIGKMRSDAVASGRGDLGAGGYGDTMRAYTQVHRARRGLEQVEKNELGQTVVAAGRRMTEEQAVRDADSIVLRSFAEGNGAGQATQGKPRSAASLAREHARIVTERVNKLNNVQSLAAMGRATADEVANAKQSVDDELAAVMGIYDVIGHTSPQIQQELANNLNRISIADVGAMGIASTTRAKLKIPPARRGMTVLELGLARTEESPRFKEDRRDFNTGYAADAAGGGGAGAPTPGGGSPGT